MEKPKRFALFLHHSLKVRLFDYKDDLQAACSALEERDLSFTVLEWSDVLEGYLAKEIWR